MKRQSPLKNPQIGRNVRRIRLEKKISIRTMCATVEPPIVPVQLLATEKLRREPTLDMVQRYAKALGVSVEVLLADDGEQQKKKRKSS